MSAVAAKGVLLVDLLRRVRLARLCLRRSRERYLAVADALHVAIEMLRERDAALDRAREQNQALRDELRAVAKERAA